MKAMTATRTGPFFRQTEPAENAAGESDPIFHPGEPKAGEVLDGRFELIELVNRGGMACIFRARDLRDGSPVAIKLPQLRYESDPVTYSRFERESEIAQKLDHPYILKILAADHPRTRPYLAMEFLEGESLHRLIGRKAMEEQAAVKIVIKICDALEHLRQHGIVHRDLKPENIIVCRDGSIRLIDFGIAAALRLRRLTFIGSAPTLGTPDYMSPEQVRGKRADHRTDIFSLGAILYQMLTGKVPFDGDDTWVVMQSRIAGDPAAPRKLNPALTPQIEEIVLHAMACNPRDRYATAAEMKRELCDYGLVKITGRAGRLQPVRIRFRHTHPWAVRGILLAILALVLMVGSFGLAYWFFLHHGRR